VHIAGASYPVCIEEKGMHGKAREVLVKREGFGCLVPKRFDTYNQLVYQMSLPSLNLDSIISNRYNGCNLLA
jgi:hypothetical protein